MILFPFQIWFLFCNISIIKVNTTDLLPGWSGFKQPPNWDVSVWDLDPTDSSNTGYENEDLIVWMRTAALPTFRKLFRRVNHTASLFSDGLPAGTYKINIQYSKTVYALFTLIFYWS